MGLLYQTHSNLSSGKNRTRTAMGRGSPGTRANPRSLPVVYVPEGITSWAHIWQCLQRSLNNNHFINSIQIDMFIQCDIFPLYTYVKTI